MKKNLLFAIIFTACSFVLMQQSRAQVAAMPYTVSLDTFSVITGDTLDSFGADDVQYPNLNIGFTFNLAGVNHDKFTATTNGFIELDTISTIFWFAPLNNTRNNIISPFGGDLMHTNANASLQYATVGTAPNRVCIIQWLHYSYFAGSGDINFQIKLYETSNCIQFVYGANSLVNNPFQTQIGIRGASNLDFIALGDTVCTWASAYPYPLISTIFPVSLSCNMPSGFAFNFGACAANGSLRLAYITGKVFEDKNSNGTFDAGDAGIANRILNIMPGNYYVSSDGAGNYAFFFLDSTVTYSLTCSNALYWNQTTSSPLNVTPLTQPCSGNNFGFAMIPNVHEVSVTCPNWGAKPGQWEPMPISYHNNGTVTESDSITFEMDSLYSFISAIPAPASVNGQTITWNYSNLLVGGYGSINLKLMPSINAVLGNYLDSKLTIYPLSTDTLPGNNEVMLHQLISNSWDPNEKAVEPQGMIPAGTTLNYTVHFQNTGNATADNVSVVDILDAGLDPMTFTLTGYSHPVNFTMSENGTATFSFYNIQLPDSGSDFAGSNGYVSFSVQTLTSLAPATVINNNAGIYFDYNPAVITNTVTNTIVIPSGIDGNQMQSMVVKTTPNPSSGNVVFAFSDNLNEKANLKITSIDGKLMMIKDNIHSDESVDISKFPGGIYLCTLASAKGNYHVKLIKE